MRAPLFTVVLPTYNRARMAASAVMSVLGQEERDFELIVVDDASTDDTQEILSKLPQDARLKLMRMEKNSRQHVCRNRAIAAARGEFITFIDSDDLYLPERLSEFRKAIEARPDVGFWFSNAFVMRFGLILGPLFDPNRKIPEGVVPGYYAVGAERLPYVTTNVAIRREAFTRFGGFREDLKILEDTNLYAAMLAGGLEVGVIRTPLSVRRLHEGQITADYAVDFEESRGALKAGNPSKAVFDIEERKLIEEIADYLLKSLEPRTAREFLRAHLKERASTSPHYKWTFLPVPVLRWLKDARRQWLHLRHHPAFASAEYQRAREYARSLINAELAGDKSA